MFVNSEYLDYEYLVEASDNYVCLADQRSVSADWQNPTTIDVIYQYLDPSIITIEAERTFNSSQTFSLVDVSDNFFERADCPQIVLTELSVIFFVLFVINALTRFVRKGGVFFGD